MSEPATPDRPAENPNNGASRIAKDFLRVAGGLVTCVWIIELGYSIVAPSLNYRALQLWETILPCILTVLEFIIVDMPRSWSDRAKHILLHTLFFCFLYAALYVAQRMGASLAADPEQSLVYILFTLAMMLAAIALFMWRCRRPILYAVAEIAFGAVSVFYASEAFINVATQANDVIKTSQSLSAIHLSSLIGVIGGFYVMTRGLDNIDKGLEKISGSRADMPFLWIRIFYGSVAASQLRSKVGSGQK